MGYLTGRDNTFLLALVNNDESDGVLADEARRELARRGALPGWAQRPAIDSAMAEAPDSLESAASQISVEPVAGMRVGGVTVQPVIGADGQPLGDGQYYRVRDVKNAQAAQQEAQMAAEWDRQAKDDMAAYGTRQLFRETDRIDPKTGYPVVEQMPSTGPAAGMELTPEQEEQQKRLQARRDAEARTRDSNAYRRAMAIRMGESAGISPLEAAAILSQPKGRAQLAMMGANRAAARRMEARERVRENAALAGGSQNLNTVMRAQIGALNMANDPRTSPDVARSLRYTLPGGRLAAEVDARQAELAARLAGNAITAALAGQGEGQGADELRARQRMERGLNLAGTAADNAGGLFGYSPRVAADNELIRNGYTAAERAVILNDLFGPAPGQATADATQTPLPLPDGHNSPVRVPDGTYPGM